MSSSFQLRQDLGPAFQRSMHRASIGDLVESLKLLPIKVAADHYFLWMMSSITSSASSHSSQSLACIRP